MTFEEELLLELNQFIESGDIVVQDSSKEYFDRLANVFPAYGSKIDWEKTVGSIEKIACKENYLESCLSFYKERCHQYKLNGKVIVVGDNSVECALLMSIDILSSCLNTLLEIPQHHYIIADDYSWCISFSMEGDMTFGFEPKYELV